MSNSSHKYYKSNYKASTSNLNVKYGTGPRPYRSATDFLIVAMLGSFVSLLHETHFPALQGSESLLNPALSQIICVYVAQHVREIRSGVCFSHFFDVSRSVPHLSSSGGHICFDFLVFFVGTACFCFTPLHHWHYHSHVSRIFHNCLSISKLKARVLSWSLILTHLSYAFW